jgi:hypothetical protein
MLVARCRHNAGKRQYMGHDKNISQDMISWADKKCT